MINGEGAEEKPSSVVASPWDRESDGGDDLSHYSSCGGESEFERYCSASSAMGTPSFRSSSFHDSDVWSPKSWKLGGENSIAKNFGGERVLLGFRESDHRSGSGRGDDFTLDGKLNGRVEGFVVRDAGLLGNFDSGRKVGIEDEDGVGISGRSDERKGFHLGEDGESEASSSDGEDSMFGCGSDEERKSGFYIRRNTSFHGGETHRNENPLVMNSAVAFGSDDWDDFAQENSFGSIVWEKSQDDRKPGMQRGNAASLLTATDSVLYPGGLSLEGQQGEVRSTIAHNQVEIGGELDSRNMNASPMSSSSKLDGQVEDVKYAAAAPNDEVSDIDELAKYIGCNSDLNLFQRDKDTVTIDTTLYEEFKICRTESEVRPQEKTNHDAESRKGDLGETNIESDPLSKSEASHLWPTPAVDKETQEARSTRDKSSFALPSLTIATSSDTAKKNFAFSFDKIEDHFVPYKVCSLL